MEDGYKAAIIVACIAASILMPSLSFESIGEVPSLREIQLPKIELPSFFYWLSAIMRLENLKT